MALPKTQPVSFIVPDGAGGDDVITVDACRSEGHNLKNTLTSNPVEEGFDITDHSRPDPRPLVLDCLVSNTPLVGQPADYATRTWDRFVDLWKRPRLITVSTSRGVYFNMGIEDVSDPVDARNAQALQFTIRMKEVRIVRNKYTRIVKATDPRAQPKVKKGGQVAQEVDKEPASLADRGAKYGAEKLAGRDGVLGEIGDWFSKAAAGPGR